MWSRPLGVLGKDTPSIDLGYELGDDGARCRADGAAESLYERRQVRSGSRIGSVWFGRTQAPEALVEPNPRRPTTRRVSAELET